MPPPRSLESAMGLEPVFALLFLFSLLRQKSVVCKRNCTTAGPNCKPWRGNGGGGSRRATEIHRLSSRGRTIPCSPEHPSALEDRLLTTLVSRVSGLQKSTATLIHLRIIISVQLHIKIRDQKKKIRDQVTRKLPTEQTCNSWKLLSEGTVHCGLLSFVSISLNLFLSACFLPWIKSEGTCQS